MRRVFEMEDLDCANCAAKMEDAIRKIEGVAAVRVLFIQQSMELEYDESREKEIFKAIKKAVRHVEPDTQVLGM
ncbi:MAG: heavy-metal-associated domain-containing protein [Paludibacteraceae bacterium]|nr:heavy-metal-associated domain-containing protein [Paludibacteraceae bacterium]